LAENKVKCILLTFVNKLRGTGRYWCGYIHWPEHTGKPSEEKTFPSLYHLWDLPTRRHSEKKTGNAKLPCIFMVCRLTVGGNLHMPLGGRVDDNQCLFFPLLW